MIKLYGTLIIFMLLPWNSLTKMRSYKHIGCFKDTRRRGRALPELMVKTSGTYTARVVQCASIANEKGYPVFSLQNGKECYSGPTADKTYNKYGLSTNCGNGVGGGWANDVYVFAADGEILWPKGTFSLLKPSTGCPTDFIENGWLIQDTLDEVTNSRSTVLSIDGHVTKGYVVRSFCTKTVGTFGEWPIGQYCIYKAASINSPRLTEGWIRMDNANNNNKDVKKMVYSTGIGLKWYSLLYMYFYCQTTGTKSVPIDLHISHPFYLLPYGSSDCQQVKWMVATKEWIQYSTRNFEEQSGQWRKLPIPYIEAGSRERPGVTMFYCLYTSCNTTLNETQGVFQSPGYPNKYPDGQLCSWTIVVPANHTVHVDFTDFSLNNTNENDTDVLEVHRLTNKTFVLSTTYKGDREPFQITASSDLLFVFRSNKENTSHGFRAKYSVFIPEVVEPTTKRPTNDLKTRHESTSPKPTTTFQEANKTNHGAFKDNSKETGTIILIVIPLVCLILVVVIVIDIYFRYSIYRSKFGRDDAKDGSRSLTDKRGVDNVTYDSREGIAMSHINVTSTTTVNTTVADDQQNTEQGYEKLDRFSPRREVHEDYQGLNRTSCLSTNGNPNLQDNGPFYDVLEGPGDSAPGDSAPGDSSAGCDNQMYQMIDKAACSNGLYAERNILYDSVA